MAPRVKYGVTPSQTIRLGPGGVEPAAEKAFAQHVPFEVAWHPDSLRVTAGSANSRSITGRLWAWGGRCVDLEDFHRGGGKPQAGRDRSRRQAVRVGRRHR